MTDDRRQIRISGRWISRLKLTIYTTYYIHVFIVPLYERFEDLPVWQEAACLYNLALDLLQAQNVRLGPGWRLQFERAALSVSSNIAEGFERLTPGELRSFLVIARGSAGEVRSMVGIVVHRAEVRPHVTHLQEIRAVAESCTRQLGAWLQTIKRPKQPKRSRGQR
jgi:four helix bundle protein